MSKVGLGIITCNREEFYKQCYESVPLDIVDTLVTVNDGDQLVGEYSHTNMISHTENKGVGVSKNEAMEYLLHNGCDHIFLIEDDIIITNPDVFKLYIETGEVSGFRHFMFGYHGPANKDQSKNPVARLRVDYSDEHKVVFNTHCVGAFCYYHKSVLDEVGLMDENFKNAWEHVEHSLQIVKAGFIPGYWWWPDVANSYEYLDELACSEDSSTIRWEDSEQKKPKHDWLENIEKGAQYFYSKHDCFPTTVYNPTEYEVIAALKEIKTKYKVCTI